MIEFKTYKEHWSEFTSKYETQPFYTTTHIMKRTGVSERTIRSRIAELRLIHEGNRNIMYQDHNNKWYISALIMDFFYSKYTPRTVTRYNQRWVTFITWAMEENYDEEYHLCVVDELRKHFPSTTDRDWLPVIEKTKRGVNHAHVLSMIPHEQVFPILNQILFDFRTDDGYDLLVGEVISPHRAERYLRK